MNDELRSVPRSPLEKAWSLEDALDLYQIPSWGHGYFSINSRGHMTVRPHRSAELEFDLMDIVEGLAGRGLTTPVLLRFGDLLEDRLRFLHGAFARAIADNDYKGRYVAVYPIKVNQQRPVVEEVFRFGSPFNYGLEAGSKPELLAVLAMTSSEPNRPVVCNGFKDDSYIEAAVLATKLGRTIIPVIENFTELRSLLRHAARYEVRPRIGVRVKLGSQGAGRWQGSSGARSKFGLFVSEILEMVAILRQAGMLDCLKLVHCHPGSQVADIRRLKDALSEVTQVYARLVGLGAGLEYLDVGGGLAVDYDGSRTNFASSMNYSLEEYASDVVYHIGAVCDRAGIAHPTIVSESGRAMTAFSSVLVFDVLGCAGPGLIQGDLAPGTGGDEVPRPIRDLQAAFERISERTLLECYHDALQAHEQALHLFSLGYLSLEMRGMAERLLWATCGKARDIEKKAGRVIDELSDLDMILSDTYFCNFSVFQSMPDSWAIGQLFPIVPIHRLLEPPTRQGVLADITCDSDGKVERFIDPRDVRHTLDLHSFSNDSRYYLGAFLVGAYQETLGDLHNLFGDTHVVHIGRRDDGKWGIQQIVKGDTAREVLSYVQYDGDRLASLVASECEEAVHAGYLTLPESQTLRRFYESELDGYTYLEPD